ncbi:universal stress protein [Desulfovermiculus halophilus]|jgi:nucleotide-binding universal stress UspA family protein|uniref:universal stress protein n=1 Tax=Desulfovermiculus halophilus TaxID=339722 RepID=UPI000489FEB2|nr:universal stress protein [Desulfovermiculus halophilus]
MSWLQKKCVVVPIDFSEESIQAVDVAREFVQESSHIHIIHVSRPWDEHEIGGTWGKETEEERIQSIQKKLREELQNKGYEDLQIDIHLGSPASEIINYAEEVDAELIVMPSHGRTGIKHFALGSVAERVVRTAHCPVLVLRHKEQKKDRKKLIAYD